MRAYVLILLLLSGLIAGVQAQPEPDEALALDVIARINQWRVDEGVWPLKPNDTLQALALDQAAYLLSFDNLPNDFHEGRRGLQPRDRAQVDPFNWPHYQLSSRIAIGENAGVGTVQSVMNFWQDSALHTRTTLNPAYREIGVAALPRGRQHVFIVVLGGRPNVLPALADPTTERNIFLTNEQFRYASGFDSIQNVTDVQVFDADGRPLFDEPLTWAATITIPESAGDTVFILSSDGKHEVVSAVNFASDQAILPGYLPSLDEAPSVAVVPTATPTLAPTLAPTQTAVTVVEATPTATLEPTIASTAVPVDVPGMRIVYTDDTLNVVNVSGEVADWQGLELVGTITFPFSQFTRVADFPLGALPNRHCVQIRAVTISGNVVLPTGCGWVRSLVTVQPDRTLWAQGPFDVRRDGVTLATCGAGAGVCEVTLR